MATENGYGPAPVVGHLGRIPNYGKTQINPMGSVEPPACIQNAMMTKDKKPFTYTPGGLDLSQIRTPSMARRMARQRSLEEQEQAHGQQSNPNYHPQGGPGGPVPPPPNAPAPPPPPPLVIEAPKQKSPKPPGPGERPEIVIPENPIGMLRKTNSPYHWETEQAEMQKMGPIPKFQEKVPSPLTVTMPPSSFSQQPPQNYTSPAQHAQRPNFQHGNQNNQPESPIYKPEAHYVNQKPTPNSNGSPITRELLQRQDSQFNKSPQPFSGQSPIANGSPYSPTPNYNWRQPERRDSPAQNFNTNFNSPQQSQNQFSPKAQQFSSNYQNQSPPANSGPVYHTLPRATSRPQDKFINNTQNNDIVYNSTRDKAPQTSKVDPSDPYPWRSNTSNRQREPQDNSQSIYHNSQNLNQQPKYTPPWTSNESRNQSDSSYIPLWKQDNKNVNSQQQQYTPPWVKQDANNNRAQENYSPPWSAQQNNERHVPQALAAPQCRQNQSQEQPRYQSSMSIPVKPRQQNSQIEQSNVAPQKEAVYVTQEPVYYCPDDSPKSIPPWVKTQKEKTKTPPPEWAQRPLEGRKSAPRELETPPRETEPEWVKKSAEMQRGIREVISPPKYPQTAQPTWSTRPSENRKSVPRDNAPSSPGTRVIPVQVEGSNSREQNQHGHQPPTLRVVINMQQPGPETQAPYSQPTQRIMRVLSPQLVRLDDGPSQTDLPSLNRSFQNQPVNHETQSHKERIIPIRIESGGVNGQNKSFGGRY